jgi:hypothetical protein
VAPRAAVRQYAESTLPAANPAGGVNQNRCLRRLDEKQPYLEKLQGFPPPDLIGADRNASE